jgi:hypothetical protein
MCAVLQTKLQVVKKNRYPLDPMLEGHRPEEDFRSLASSREKKVTATFSCEYDRNPSDIDSAEKPLRSKTSMANGPNVG